MIGFIGGVLVIVIALGVIALYRSAKQEELEKKVYQQPDVEYERLREDQIEKLEQDAHWVVTENEDGTTDRRLVIPIDQAMDEVVREYGTQKTARK